jgi:hypothetical protein
LDWESGSKQVKIFPPKKENIKNLTEERSVWLEYSPERPLKRLKKKYKIANFE